MGISQCLATMTAFLLRFLFGVLALLCSLLPERPWVCCSTILLEETPKIRRGAVEECLLIMTEPAFDALLDARIELSVAVAQGQTN